MSRILVTGYPGWLANALVEDLIRGEIAGITSIRLLVHPAEAPTLGKSGKALLPIEIHRASLTDPDTLRGASEGCDLVLHSAGVIHVRRTHEWYDVNEKGTGNLLEECARSGSVKRFVYISSNAAAGRSPRPDRLMTEADPPRPMSDYGKSKLRAEMRVQAYSKRFETVVLRPCMFYGPPVPERHLGIYRRILRTRMPIVGRGDYSRSVTHVQNLVQACELALTHPEAVGNTYFIADRAPYTLRELIDAMGAALGVSVSYFWLPALASKFAHLIDTQLARLGLYWRDLHLLGEADWNVGVSIEKARNELGYEPRVELHAGMMETVRWCRQKGLLS